MRVVISMIRLPKPRKGLLILFTSWFVLGVYFPYILNGGWICDDWMVIDHLQHHAGFWDYVRSWFPIFSARPLAPLILAAITHLYDDYPTYYVASQCLLLILSWTMLSFAWCRVCGVTAGTVFLILVSLPSVASTLVFSPAMQHLAAVSYLLWTTSFLLHERAFRHSGSGFLLTLSGILLFLGMLLYEIFLPLLVFQCLMPLFLCSDYIKSVDPALRNSHNVPVRTQSPRPESHPTLERRHPAAKAMAVGLFRVSPLAHSLFVASLPVVLAVFFGLIIQKLVAPLFLPDMSRLNPGGLGMMARTFAYWVFAVTVQTPLLWAEALARLPEAWDAWSIVTFFGVLVFLFITYQKESATRTKDSDTRNYPADDTPRPCILARPMEASPSLPHVGLSADGCITRLRRISLSAALLSSTLFVLSGSYAAIYGNDNRKFSSFWVAVALWLSTFWAQPAKTQGRTIRTYCGMIVAIVIAFCNTSSFLLQRNNYLVAWRAQQAILSAIHDDLQHASNEFVAPGAVVLAAVPPVVPGNHNDECVFTRSWDIASALRYTTKGRISDAVTLYPWLAVQGRIGLEDTRLSVDGLWEVDLREKPVYFFGCELEYTPPRGWRAFLERAIGEIGELRAVTVVNLQPIPDSGALEAAVKRGTLELNRHHPMSLPARVTQGLAESIRRHFLGKTVPPVPERLFHPTIIDKAMHKGKKQ